MQLQQRKSVASPGLILQSLCALPFMAFGVFLVVLGLRKWPGHDEEESLVFLIAGALFCAMGLGVVAALWRKQKKQTRQRQIEESRPDAPWLWQPDWFAGRIKCSSGPQLRIVWLFGVAFCGFSVPFLLVLPEELRKGNTPALFGLVFPVAGIGFLSWAVCLTLRWKRFGSSSFQMARVPGIIGGTLTGTIHIPARLQPRNGVSLRLRCVRRVTTGSGKNRSTSEEVVWEDEKLLGNDLPQSGFNEFEIPVFFQIPSDCHQTGGDARDQILWRLTARAKHEGPDYNADFVVPVFRTAQSGAGTALVADTTARYQVPFDPISRAAQLGIRVNLTLTGGAEFVFPVLRNLGLKLLLMFWWMLITAGFAAVIHFRAGMLAIGVLGLFEAILSWLMANTWLRSSRVVAEPGKLTIINAWLGLGLTRNLSPDEVSKIQSASGHSAGETVYYDVKVTTHAGQTITAATAIRSKPVAEWLAQEMTRLLRNELQTLPAGARDVLTRQSS